MSKRILLFSCLTLLLLTPGAAGAADIGFYGAEVRAGVVFPSDWDTGFTVGGSVNLGELTDGLYLYPGVFYSQAEETEGFAGVDVDVEVTSLALGAEVRYFLDGEARGFYFGGGPYLHFLEAEAGATVPPFGRVVTVTVDSEEIGAMGVAGYRFGGARSSFFVEGRYGLVTDFNSAQLLAGFSF